MLLVTKSFFFLNFYSFYSFPIITLVEWFVDILKFGAPGLTNGLPHNRMVFNSVLLFLTRIRNFHKISNHCGTMTW